MRPISFLLVAAAGLLVSCEALSAATDSTQTKLSMTSTSDTVQQLNAPHGGKRFLRTTKETLDDDDDDDEDEDEEEEERNALARYVKSYGQAWVDKWVLRSSERVSAGKTPGQMKEKYTDLRGNWFSEKARDKYNLFLAAWLKKHPGGT
ncbi:hypothetical protein PHYBOEH_002185 [Phytophthora boehmeriae]|uniref:RxLR effector protein n=1 Tax=Phytophthora boehmeriae TaxID=109152 RepID=A0A8T1V7Y8_9STRA|nr:hypothetical protein PHYBOEH_002185 [Phytophthora boehmeriae]